MKLLPAPDALGLPPQFDKWRNGQQDVIERGEQSKERVDVVNAPTGFGKSLPYMYQAMKASQENKRTLITVGTKGMQAQLEKTFGSMDGVTTLMGKRNYPCPLQADYTCQEGHMGKCPYRKTRMCKYTAARQDAIAKPILITNNKCWIANNRFGIGLGTFDQMIVDEVHELPGELEAAMHTRIGERDIKDILKMEMLKDTFSMEAWKVWAGRARHIASMTAQDLKDEIENTSLPTPKEIRHFIRVRSLLRKLIILSDCTPDNWIVEHEGDGLYTFDPINPSSYGESVFFRGIPKIRMYSATVRHKTVRLGGIYESYNFREYPSAFSPSRFRVHHVETMKMDRNTVDYSPWLRMHDSIIRARKDRNGIIHTGSKERRDLILDNSRFKDMMISNGKDDVTADIVQAYRDADEPTVLVSPSITTGWDFPGPECEYQIIGKVPFPPMNKRIVQMRQERDKDYGAFIAMTTLVQACGRGFRSIEDMCENFILDDHFIWFWKRYYWLAPEWFQKLVNFASSLPRPQPKLAKNWRLAQ